MSFFLFRPIDTFLSGVIVSPVMVRRYFLERNAVFSLFTANLTQANEATRPCTHKEDSQRGYFVIQDFLKGDFDEPIRHERV